MSLCNNMVGYKRNAIKLMLPPTSPTTTQIIPNRMLCFTTFHETKHFLPLKTSLTISKCDQS